MSMTNPDASTYVTINPYGGAGDGTGPTVGGERQDLTDILSRIDPTETPFYSNATKASMRATFQEWQVQELNTVAKTAQPEGFKAALQAVKPTDRLGNDAQIFARTWSVSKTFDAIDVAGRARESAYQKMLRGLELRRDLEAKLLDNVDRVGEANRTLSGFMTWITNGGISGVGGYTGDDAAWGTGPTASPPAGDGTDSAVIDSPAALSFGLIDQALENVYNAGGEPSVMQVTPAGKRIFSKLNSGQDQLAVLNQINQTSVRDAAYIGSISVYLSDYGRLDVAINRFQPGSGVLGGGEAYETMFLIDRRHYQVTTLPGRSFSSETLGKVGDSTDGYVVHEGSFRVSAPKAHGIVCHV